LVAGKGKKALREGPPAAPAALRRSSSHEPTPNGARRVTPRGALLSPTIDFLSVGGLSLLLMVPLLLSGRADLVLIGAGAQAWIATAINMPHFMASYRLVYGSKRMVLQHKWAAIYVPLFMLAFLAAAIWEAQESQALVLVFITVASVYLAWHYTGQVWGMMASFAYLGGTSFDKTERTLIRSSLRILLAWHVAWFLFTQLRDPSRVVWIYRLASGATVLAFALGAYGLYRLWRRTKAIPPVLSIVAWGSLFVWYAVMARDPKALFWVQIAHALQYLAFPVRVELNNAEASERALPSAMSRGSRTALHMVLYGAGLLLVSVLVAQVVPMSLMGVIGKVFGEEPGKAAPILILMFINIHHFFTDGVLWKISNPEVRQSLFAHVPPS